MPKATCGRGYGKYKNKTKNKNKIEIFPLKLKVLNQWNFGTPTLPQKHLWEISHNRKVDHNPKSFY